MAKCLRLECSNELTGKQAKYCCLACKKTYLQSRPNCRYKTEPNGRMCKKCELPLIGRQRDFCSNTCKCAYRYQNNKTENNQASYKAQQIRGKSRKQTLVAMKGGECELCGYRKNLSSLAFHHLNESTKLFTLDIRNISNRAMDILLNEASKCQLLCHNCHGELHNPDMAMSTN